MKMLILVSAVITLTTSAHAAMTREEACKSVASKQAAKVIYWNEKLKTKPALLEQAKTRISGENEFNGYKGAVNLMNARATTMLGSSVTAGEARSSLFGVCMSAK